MKTREFNIENYDTKRFIQTQYRESVSMVKFEGLNLAVSVNYYNVSLPKDYWDKVSGKMKKKAIAHFKAEHKEKSTGVIKEFNGYKKYADKILFDDKAYIEILDILEDNYYCQALTMLKDIVYAKTKGSNVKAMKYQARKLQADDISCD